MYKRIEHEGKRYYGKHMLVHLTECNEAILEMDSVKEFITNLVESIDMVAFGECHCHRFGEGEEVGLSAVQMIYTSNITLHTNDLHREAYLDVFSCKDYLEEDVIKSVKNVFNPKSVDYEIVWRA